MSTPIRSIIGRYSVLAEPTDYVRQPFDADGRWDAPDVKHLDGVPWWKADVPPRWHACWVQSDAWFGLDQVQRCACGAIRGHGISTWSEKNSRERVAK